MYFAWEKGGFPLQAFFPELLACACFKRGGGGFHVFFTACFHVLFSFYSFLKNFLCFSLSVDVCRLLCLFSWFTPSFRFSIQTKLILLGFSVATLPVVFVSVFRIIFIVSFLQYLSVGKWNYFDHWFFSFHKCMIFITSRNEPPIIFHLRPTPVPSPPPIHVLMVQSQSVFVSPPREAYVRLVWAPTNQILLWRQRRYLPIREEHSVFSQLGHSA